MCADHRFFYSLYCTRKRREKQWVWPAIKLSSCEFSSEYACQGDGNTISYDPGFWLNQRYIVLLAQHFIICERIGPA